MKICRRLHRHLFCTFHPLFSALSRPLFFFCFLLAVSPGILLASLLGWKALFFPAAVPHLLWGIFLPLWLMLSCGIPALCASAVLSARRELCIRQMSVTVPICTMQMLLAFLFALWILYRMPPFFCMLTSAVCAVSALLSVRFAAKWQRGLGVLMLIGGIWNTLLVFLCADF